MKLEITYPDTEEGWHKQNPNFTTEIIEVTDKIVSISPYQWGDKVGLQIYFITEKLTSYWHFTTQNIIAKNWKFVQYPEQPEPKDPDWEIER